MDILDTCKRRIEGIGSGIEINATLEQEPSQFGGFQSEALLDIPPDSLPDLNNSLKRRRKDIHNPGRNLFGRSGTLRCAQCRRRNSKCIFSSEWMPCDFCRSRTIAEPCVKLRGPKVEARSPPSWPITVFDPSIETEDVLLLQYAYSIDFVTSLVFPFIGQLFPKFAVVYGPSIQHTGLRYAVLDYVAGMANWSAVSDIDPQQYRIKAMRSMITKSNDPSNIDEADLFVTALLAISSSTISDKGMEEFRVHTAGCLSVMTHLYSYGGKSLRPYLFSRFWPVVRDALYFYSGGSLVSGKDDWDRFYEISRQIMGIETFKQQQEYENELQGSYQPATKSTVGVTVTSMQQFWLLENCLKQIAKRQWEGIFEHDSYVNSVVAILRDDPFPLNESDVLVYIEASLASMGDISAPMTPEETLSIQTAAAHSARLLLLISLRRVLLIALQAKSIIEGLSSKQGIDAGIEFVSLVERVGGAVYEAEDGESERLMEGERNAHFRSHHSMDTLRDVLDGSPWMIYGLEGVASDTVYSKVLKIWESKGPNFVVEFFERFPAPFAKGKSSVGADQYPSYGLGRQEKLTKT